MSVTKAAAVDRHAGNAAAVLLLATALLAGACSPAQNGRVDSTNVPADVVTGDAHVTMQRMPCFGTCPVYTVEIGPDGTVTFTGERFVQTTGTATAMIGADAAAALVKDMVEAGFFELEDRYTYDAKVCGQYHTDAPRVKLTLRTGARVKSVEHDYGCSDVPAELRAMQEKVDSVAGVKRWIEGV